MSTSKPADPLTVIAHFGDEGEARLAAARLEMEELDVHLDLLSTRHGLGPRAAKLAVPASQVTAAVVLLQQTPARVWLVEPRAC
ncbi:MAG TPA: hypothetical protein VGN72_14140 [Tepidisphaeraceae bacterium]|jgi:hypothetical protein|nr:hypothetical protein [Tepidisphaeraceae bacterium]